LRRAGIGRDIFPSFSTATPNATLRQRPDQLDAKRVEPYGACAAVAAEPDQQSVGTCNCILVTKNGKPVKGAVTMDHSPEFAFVNASIRRGNEPRPPVGLRY
jgi:hypothetical protein